MERAFGLIELKLIGGPFAAEACRIGLLRLDVGLQFAKLLFKNGVFFCQTGNAVLVGLNAIEAALHHTIEFGDAGDTRLILCACRFGAVANGGVGETGLRETSLSVQKIVFRLLNDTRLRRDGVGEALATVRHVSEALGQFASTSRRAFRCGDEGGKIAGNGGEAVAVLSQVAAQGFLLALLLRSGAAALVEKVSGILKGLGTGFEIAA